MATKAQSNFICSLLIEREKVYTYEKELQLVDLRAYQVITNQHALINKQLDYLK